MVEAVEPQGPERPPGRRFFWPGGLSARLLILTILFVALAGLFILPPALAAFEEKWLLDRVRAAELASLATEVAPDRVVTAQLSSQLLTGAGVETVAIQAEGMRRLVLQGPRRDQTPYLVDLRDQAPTSWLTAPFQTLLGGPGRAVRVIAQPRFRSADFIEVVAPDAQLRAELSRYLWQLVLVTIFVAGLAGGLVYLSLNLFLVRPMQRITRAMERFRADPDDPSAHLAPSGRRDEIGRAELELDRMQADLRAALSSRARLAALGEAVAKINHDLRNMLTSARMASERLSEVRDPIVAQALPRLERAIDRAVKLASHVLAYGKTQEALPVPAPIPLAQALVSAAEEAGLGEGDLPVVLHHDIGAEVEIEADPEQFHRIAANLMRNAREAIQHEAPRRGGEVTVTLGRDDRQIVLRFTDTGPGIPERVQARIFQPFSGSSRSDGTGLGLAISRELAQAHGGDLVLAETGPSGSSFELHLPQR